MEYHRWRNGESGNCVVDCVVHGVIKDSRQHCD